MPFRTTYTIVDVGPYIGWTNGINIALSDVSFILLFLYLVITGKRFEGFSRKTHRRRHGAARRLGTPVAGQFDMDPRLLLRGHMVVQVFFLYYVVLTAAIETQKELRMVIVMLMLSLIVQGAFGDRPVPHGQGARRIQDGDPRRPRRSAEGLVTRALGTVGKPNGLAMYVMPLILLVTAILMRSSGFYRKLGILAVIRGRARAPVQLLAGRLARLRRRLHGAPVRLVKGVT